MSVLTLCLSCVSQVTAKGHGLQKIRQIHPYERLVSTLRVYDCALTTMYMSVFLTAFSCMNTALQAGGSGGYIHENH